MLPTLWRFFFLFLFFVRRAIPEAGYITLGTIRYGVKLSQGCLSSNCTHFRSSSLSTAENISKTAYSSKNSTSNINSMGSEHDTEPPIINGFRSFSENANSSVCSSSMPNVCDSDNSDVTSVSGSCCLNTTKCSLPWMNKVDTPRSNDSCKFIYFMFFFFATIAKHNNVNWVSGCVGESGGERRDVENHLIFPF